MNREDQEFEQLRRLLKLKRYEQPPPRYFNDFSTQVVARLKASQVSSAGDSWWQRLWAGLELRPAFPVALSAAVCGLLVLGAVYSDKADVPEEFQGVTSGLVTRKAEPGMDTTTLVTIGQPPQIELASFSTNPVPAANTLFDRIGLPASMRASHPMFR